MPTNNNRGTAMLEAAPVMLLLTLFCVGIVLAAYLFFTRAWIQYHSEQALYCAAQSRVSFHCKYQLEEKLKQLLPWGESSAHILAGNDKWTVEVLWKYRDFSFHLNKELTPQQILNAKALQW
ncbi:MAG: hypothetical protein ACXVA9_06340 [Bdellovibrionales bacterium]